MDFKSAYYIEYVAVHWQVCLKVLHITPAD